MVENSTILELFSTASRRCRVSWISDAVRDGPSPNSAHHLTGVDQAAMLLDLARSRFPRRNWVEAHIEEFEPAERFAGVVCWDVLFHLERSLHEALLSRIAKMLGAGGRLMLTVGGSDHRDAMPSWRKCANRQRPDLQTRTAQISLTQPRQKGKLMNLSLQNERVNHRR